MSQHQGEGQVGHQRVDLRVSYFLLQQVKTSEPVQTSGHILQSHVFELDVDIIVKHSLHHSLILSTTLNGGQDLLVSLSDCAEFLFTFTLIVTSGYEEDVIKNLDS